MSHFPQYTINSTSNETNQFNMQGFDANMLKNLIENNNVLTQNINPQDVTYMQQTKMPNQYIIQLPNNNVAIQQPYMQMMQFPYGNIYYVNQPTQFATNDNGVQYNATPILPIQLAPGVMQVDVNDLNKINQQNTAPNSSRSRKRSYSNQPKLEPDIQSNPNEEVLRDTRNRPLLYSCSDCSRKFSMQSRLTQHKKCHSGIRPYACSSCSFAFTQKSYLVRHAAVHKEERPYVCELCQKTYKHYGSLANHRKTHKNGAKAAERTTNNINNSNNIDNNVSNEAIVNCKTEEIVDMNNNSSTKSYVPVSNGEFVFQTQPEMQSQSTDQNQSYTNQFTTDISTDLFSNSFQNQLSGNLSTDINPSFISQLNFHNNNFYSLIDSSTNESVKLELSNHDQVTSDLNNNSSISIESSSQPLNLT